MYRQAFNKSCRLPSKLGILLIRGYQCLLSPWLKPSCRFSPSCSQYGLDAIRQRGLIRGGCLLFRRLCCCHPFHRGGYDPVPPLKKDKSKL